MGHLFARGLCLCMLLACTPFVAMAAPDCADTTPPGKFTCAQQKDLGKCKAEWMTDGGFCKKTCGACEESKPAAVAKPTADPVAEDPKPAAEPKPVAATKPVAAPAKTPDACTDTQPPGKYTCEQQKEYGACKADWMTTGKFCEVTCGVCVPAEVAQAEYSAALTDAANELLGVDATPLAVEPVALPTIDLPTTPRFAQPQPQVTPTTLPPVNPLVPAKPTTSAIAVPLERVPNAVLPVGDAVEALAPASEEQDALVAPKADNCKATALAALIADPELSTTVKAAQALNIGAVLQDPKVNFTMFAPTNDAWEAAALATGQTVSQLLSSRNVLRDALFTHIIANSIIDSEKLATLPSFTPNSKSVVYVAPAAGPGGAISLISTASTARVIGPDAASGCNFVIHVVDNVLFPNPSPRGGINPAYQAAMARGGATAGTAGR